MNGQALAVVVPSSDEYVELDQINKSDPRAPDLDARNLNQMVENQNEYVGVPFEESLVLVTCT